MMQRSIGQTLGIFALSFSVLFPACSQQKEADSAADYNFTPAEARDYLLNVRAEGDPNAPTPQDPKNIAEVLEVLDHEEVWRLEGAARFMEGKPGIDALTVRARIQLLSADVYSMVADVLDELGARNAEELARLEKKKADGFDLAEDEKTAAKHREEMGARFGKASAALRTLSKEHLEAGGSLAIESVKRFPKEALGYRAAAYYYLLDGDWLKFDDMMAVLQSKGDDSPAISYFTALEALYRKADRPLARQYFQEALSKEPSLVRPQAALVLVQDDVESRHAELVKLKAMNADHPIVNIAGPAITQEFEFANALKDAR